MFTVVWENFLRKGEEKESDFNGEGRCGRGNWTYMQPEIILEVALSSCFE
jgi:hypothetical protein